MKQWGNLYISFFRILWNIWSRNLLWHYKCLCHHFSPIKSIPNKTINFFSHKRKKPYWPKTFTFLSPRYSHTYTHTHNIHDLPDSEHGSFHWNNVLANSTYISWYTLTSLTTLTHYKQFTAVTSASTSIAFQ